MAGSFYCSHLVSIFFRPAGLHIALARPGVFSPYKKVRVPVNLAAPSGPAQAKVGGVDSAFATTIR